MSAEAHAEGVARVRTVLAEVGLRVEDELVFGHPDSIPDVYPESSRLTFGASSDGGVGFVVVTTDPRGLSRVTGGSFPFIGTSTLLVDTFESNVRAYPHPDLGSATNAEVARVLALYSATWFESVEKAFRTIVADRVPLLIEGLLEPEVAPREGVLLALEVADLVDTGAPLEWALRRVSS